MIDNSSLITHHSSLPFYIVGGTVRRDAPCYVRRRADSELYESLRQGNFCYALTARQMGKSSLMVRTAMQLREEGVGVAVLDLTAIGQNIQVEQWYSGLLNQIGQQLDLEDELLEFWDASDKLGALQRWMQAIRQVVLPRYIGQVVIFVDEIDTVRSLPFSTDEFFAGIREFFNHRTEDEELERLVFCLLGVATPSDLIRDTRTTPFNIGRRIELNDFTEAEAAPLAQGLMRPEPLGMKLLQRILYWTGGHPYLTQRLCQGVADDKSVTDPAGVDRLCEKMFLSSRARELDDNLLFVRERILRSETNLANLLDLYSQVRDHKRVLDEDTNPLVGLLRLSGITRIEDGRLAVRNRIYSRVFDGKWITANMPDAEMRRQQAAYRRGLFRAGVYATLVLLIVGGLAFTAIKQRNLANKQAQETRNALIEVAEQKRLAEVQRQLAVEQENIAEQQGESNRRLLYIAHMNLAQKAWETSNIARVVDLLEKYRPEPGQEDLRGFEWYYLWRLCHPELRALQLPANIGTVAFSADGRMVAVCVGKIVKLIDVASGRERFLSKARADEIKAVTFSPDGRRLATGRLNGTIRIWDSARGRESTFNTDMDQITSLSFSPDGKRLAAGSQNGAVEILDLVTGREPLPLEGHTDSVTSIAFSSDGGKLATGSEDGTAIVWDAINGKKLNTLGEHKNTVTSVVFSNDGGKLAAGNQDGSAKIWGVKQGQELLPLEGHTGAVTSVAFFPDGVRLVTGSSDSTARLWDLTMGQPLLTVKGHLGPIISVAIVHEGKQLVTASNDGTLRLWDLAAMEVLTGEHEKRIQSIATSPDGKWLATASWDRTVKLWDAVTGKSLYTLNFKDLVTSVAFSRERKQLVTGSGDTVTLWDLTTRHPITIEDRLNHVNSVAISPDGRLLAIADDDEAIRLVDLQGKRELALFKGHTRSVTCVVFSPDGRYMATGSLDGTAKLWDIAGRRELHSFKKRKSVLTSVHFSPDGKHLATGGQDGVTTLWDIATAVELASFEGHAGWVTAVSFSPDGKRLATGSADSTVKLWDVATRQEVYVFKEHSDQVSSIAFSADGAYLVTCGWDKTWKLFRAATNRGVTARSK